MRKRTYNHHKRNFGSIFKIFLVLLLILLLTGLVLFLLDKKGIIDVPLIGGRTSQNTEDINYNPPTKEDKQENDQHKENLGDSSDKIKSSTTPTLTQKSVTPTIVDASQYGSNIEVRAYVVGIIEDSGTCTLLLTKGSEIIKKESAGIANVSDTQCTTFTVPRSAFSSVGSWSVVVTYSSSAHQGNSATKTLEIR